MGYFKNPPKIPIPRISDYDSFIYKYKISIRRAVASFIDDPHYHEHIAIWYNTSGEYDMYFNGETVHCSAGTLLFIPPFAVHAMDTRNVDLSSTQIISISMPNDALHSRSTPVYPLAYNIVACGRKTIPLCLQLCGDEKETADELFTSALFEYGKKGDMHRTRIFDYVDGIIILCSRHFSGLLTQKAQSSARARYEKIAPTVREAVLNYTHPPSIEQAAEKARLTPRGFTKLFKSITNLTYHDFSTAARAMEAVKLLKYSTKSISEIAEECGYSDNSHFTKTFIKLFGSPPHRLRREMIEITRSKEKQNHLTDSLHSWESTLDPEIIREHRLISLGKEYV